MEIPDIAIEWLLAHAANNVELATLSNVCRKWRKLAVIVVLEQGRKALANENNKARSDQSSDGNSDGNGKACNLLLLPSMVRHLLCEKRSMDFDVETFCIAWFHPEGMQVTRVSVDNIDDSEEEYMASPEPFAPSGGPSYAGSEEEGKGSSRRKARSKSPTPVLRAVGVGLERLEAPSKQVSCLYQWNGYQDAVDVLRPFGYAPAFVKVSSLGLVFVPTK
jgi:hypothetical protein